MGIFLHRVLYNWSRTVMRCLESCFWARVVTLYLCPTPPSSPSCESPVFLYSFPHFSACSLTRSFPLRNWSDGHSDRTLCPFSALLLERVSLLPSHLPPFLQSLSFQLSVPPLFLFFPYGHHLSFSNLPFGPIPSTSLPWEHPVCCCAVFWYMCVFGRSMLSREPDWPGRSKQREETWQRKRMHTHTHTHTQILEHTTSLQRPYSCCPELQTSRYWISLHVWTWPAIATAHSSPRAFLFWLNLWTLSRTGFFALPVNAQFFG